LRGAAERGGSARMWPRSRVMMSPRAFRSFSVRGANSSLRVTSMWPGRTWATRARPASVMVTRVARWSSGLPTAEWDGSLSASHPAGMRRLGCSQSFTASIGMLLASGKAAPIASVKKGDKVLAVNTKTGKTKAKTVQAVMARYNTDLYDLLAANVRVLRRDRLGGLIREYAQVA
jgi:hypothetical protein